jgi:hypothetical protein
MTTPAPGGATNCQLSAPLTESEYSNGFYTIISGHDLTIVFMRTTALMGPELAEANANNLVHVTPVGTIVLARSAAASLAKQILKQLNLSPNPTQTSET